MAAFQHSFRIRKCLRIPGEIAPLKRLHPVAVKVKDVQGNITVRHTVYKPGGGLLIVTGRKGGREPQSEGPGRRKGWSAGQFRIFGNGSFRTGSVNHTVVKAFPFHGELYALHLLAGNLIGGIPFVFQKDAISFVGNVKRNIFIRNLAGSSAILIPHLHTLSVFYEWSIAFSQTVDIFIHVDGKLFCHVTFSGLPICHICHIPKPGIRQFPVSVQKTDSPGIRPFINHRSGTAAAVANLFVGFLNHGVRRCTVNPGKGTADDRTVKMADRHPDDILHRAGQPNCQHPYIQTVAAV